MPRRPASPPSRRPSAKSTPKSALGRGGELQQTSAVPLTTNHGVPISDNQSSLRGGTRGPTLLEDNALRDKITQFDHERIPERVVHARGSAAHGYFQAYKSAAKLTRAAFLQDPKKKTPVFARFSTVAGGAGSVDTPRDVRGFAVKFYTEEGNFDLVGNNIPVFFIQDAIKFPDLIHAVKMEPDRGFPQAATAHDTFWDFVSLMPESMHMLLWAMSDRTLPRSLRMMEGFGIHTFRFLDERGASTFVKFHWRPMLGAQSTTWDEAVKLAGADPDFHRRDLHDAIAAGDFPAWEFSVQAFSQKQADAFDFDVLDPTKIIPEEVIPLTPLGKMVLDRNPDNFFAETEQVAFHPGNVVPGIDFSDDPLLQGRLFSYIDTQMTRLGGPNFHQIPINAPKCPFHNMSRDGFHQQHVPTGRVAYEPSSLEPDGPRANPRLAGSSFPEPLAGTKQRVRSETFSDHYSQARMFFRSMTEPEQLHIVKAFTFELGKVATIPIRTRMLGHLALVDEELEARVAEALGMEGQADVIQPARAPVKLAPSPALSIIGKAPRTLRGRKVGVLVTDGSDGTLVQRIVAAVKKEGAQPMIVAPKAGGAKLAKGGKLAADFTIEGGPSALFDAVVLLPSKEGAQSCAENPAAIEWVMSAHTHLKVIGYAASSQALLDRAGIELDEGVVSIEKSAASFMDAALGGRIWSRE